MLRADQKRNLKPRIRTLNFYHYYLLLRRKGVRWFKLGLTKKVQGRGWLPQCRVFSGHGAGEGRDAGWNGCCSPDPSVASEVCSFLFLESQIIRARLQTCFSLVFTRVSDRADSGKNTEMALNNSESHGKKVPLAFSSTPADYSRRKSLFPANMSLTPR